MTRVHSSSFFEGLGLGLETRMSRSCSWSRDQGPEVLVLVSRPQCQGLGLGLEFFKKVLTTTLHICCNGFHSEMHLIELSTQNCNLPATAAESYGAHEVLCRGNEL